MIKSQKFLSNLGFNHNRPAFQLPDLKPAINIKTRSVQRCGLRMRLILHP